MLLFLKLNFNLFCDVTLILILTFVTSLPEDKKRKKKWSQRSILLKYKQNKKGLKRALEKIIKENMNKEDIDQKLRKRREKNEKEGDCYSKLRLCKAIKTKYRKWYTKKTSKLDWFEGWNYKEWKYYM